MIPPLSLIGRTYFSWEAVNIRSGPSLADRIVGHLAPNEGVEIVGKVLLKSWYMIAQHKVADGFVYAQLLHPTRSAQAVLQFHETPVAPVEISVASTAPTSPSPAKTKQVTPASADTVAMSAMTAQTCRMVNQKVTMDNGQNKSQTIMACRGPKGWKIIKVA